MRLRTCFNVGIVCNYIVSGSQNAAGFSNRGEFILPVFSQGIVLRCFSNPVTKSKLRSVLAYMEVVYVETLWKK